MNIFLSAISIFWRSYLTASEEEGWQHSQPVIITAHTFTIRLTVHPTFPFKTVEQYTNNRIDQNYSTAYKIASLAYYTPSKRDFKKPSKEHRKLKDKIMEIYAK